MRVSPSASGSAYLGVDLGTSGLKVVLVRADGSVLAEAEAGYAVHAPQPGHAESDPADWAEALGESMAKLSAGLARRREPIPDVGAVGMAGQMHGVVLVAADGSPVRPAMLWPDQRATPELATWRALPGSVRGRLANPLVSGMAGPMLAWLRQHEPASLNAAVAAVSPKDWLRGSMTSDRVTERSDASATLLWDVVSDGWSPEALDLAGVAPSLLPDVVASDHIVATTRMPDFGAPAQEVPVVAGGADTACALTALEAVRREGQWGETLVVNVGTGIQILRPGAEVLSRADPDTHLYADTGSGWYEMLAVQNGGLALTWVQDVLGLSWKQFALLARQSAPGSSGAVFVPFLTGERGAVATPDSSAAWTGLTLSVGRSELARSAFEGLAFTIRRGIEMSGGHTGPVLLSGGGAREPWVRQLVADVTGLSMRHIDLRTASAMGAAVLAARGVGVRLPILATGVDVVPMSDVTVDAAYDRWLSSQRPAAVPGASQ